VLGLLRVRRELLHGEERRDATRLEPRDGLAKRLGLLTMRGMAAPV
jgi:hypothetical protein